MTNYNDINKEIANAMVCKCFALIHDEDQDETFLELAKTTISENEKIDEKFLASFLKDFKNKLISDIYNAAMELSSKTVKEIIKQNSEEENISENLKRYDEDFLKLLNEKISEENDPELNELLAKLGFCGEEEMRKAYKESK